MKSLYSLVLLAALPLISCSSGENKTPSEAVTATPRAKTLPQNLKEAIDSSFRNPENKKRDVYRHPKETLEFFGLEPSMKVIEISPGAGWYSEILAPVLTTKGEFIAATVPGGDSKYLKKMESDYANWVKSNPELKVKIISFNPPQALAVETPVDMILTFRNIHNWMPAPEAQKAFRVFFDALKPGGVLGVVEHREDAKKKQDPKAESGYIKESEVIKIAQKAGFKLAEKSEINANPKDTKDYADGVWTLPPSLKKGAVDRQKYIDIGESDRMTLKFVKPEPKNKKSKG